MTDHPDPLKMSMGEASIEIPSLGLNLEIFPTLPEKDHNRNQWFFKDNIKVKNEILEARLKAKDGILEKTRKNVFQCVLVLPPKR